MVPGKKECLGCFELIHEKAKKCPQCQQIQSKLYTTQYNKWVMVPLVTILLGFVLYLFNDILRMTKGGGPEVLVVESSVLFSRNVSGTDFVSCSGILSNNSGRDAADIDLRADFFDEKEQLIDTFAVRSNLRVNSGEKSSYRVRAEADKPLDEYKGCKVAVLDQWFKS